MITAIRRISTLLLQVALQVLFVMFVSPTTQAEEVSAESKPAGTGLVWDQRFADHDTGPGHPENASRLNAIEDELEEAGIKEKLTLIAPRSVKDTWILKAHTREYLETVKRAHEEGLRLLPTGDTPFSPRSLETARLAAGGLLEACDQVMAGNVNNAFVAARPPGHHATRGKGMGFCVFGNVGIAAKYLQEKHGLKRILVVDWDVHHGNGTYDILKEDPKVFQFQIHQGGIYPGTGAVEDVGEGEAEGNTLNVPLPAGAGRKEFLQAFDEKLIPAMTEFKPEFILISAGFDAHKQDLLGGLNLSSQDYGDLTRRLKIIAEEHGEGRIVSVLEGGYHLKALSESVRFHIEALME